MLRKFARATVVSAVSLAMISVLGGTTAQAATTPVPHERMSIRSDGRLELQLADPQGASGKVVLGLTNGTFTDIEVEAHTDGRVHRDRLTVESFAVTGSDNFRAALRSKSGGNLLHIDSTKAVQQAFPVLFILGLLARLGIRHVIRWYGKTQLKKASKSYLLNSVGANKWRHILDPKHKWGSVGAKSREQVAELMGRAMAEGRHGVYQKSGRMATWNHRGKTIVVTYAKDSGRISNGWVK